jgi:hypothetical protein
VKIIAGKINDEWLEDLLGESRYSVDEVKAAVAYAHGLPKLFDFCFKNKIKLTFWGRFDHTIPVSTDILKRFLENASLNFDCKLNPDIFHSKIIWWVGFGVYIGSANLTDSAWYQNIECGVFLSETEMIDNDLIAEIDNYFIEIDKYSHPLTLEILKLLETTENNRAAAHEIDSDIRRKFALGRKSLIPEVRSILSRDKKTYLEKTREAFLKEWYETLHKLRNISKKVSSDEYRPMWINPAAPEGVQADRFLHTYYISIKEGNRSRHEEYYLKNKGNPDKVLSESMMQWKDHEKPPYDEEMIVNEWAPFLKNALTQTSLKAMTKDKFYEICSKVHAMRDHATKVDNKTYNLPINAKKKSQDECIKLLSEYLLNQKSDEEKSVVDVIEFVLYGGDESKAPDRIWEATQSGRWKIPHLGISALGEIVGWAFPGTFPPRNGRTSKALKALGYNVKIHTE